MRSADFPTNPAARFLEQLQTVAFVRNVSFAPSRKEAKRFDGTLTIRTEQGTFRLVVQFKLSYLDRASTNALVAHAALLQREGHSFLLFARYVPRPTGEQLVAADVNFIDLAGNIHLSLGKKYARTYLGKSEAQNHDRKRALTAAQMQLLFLFAAEPAARKWPVRQIAAQAGVSKSKAAEVREQLVTLPPREIRDLLIKGYAEVLRPKLVLGRFRSQETKPEKFLARLPTDLAPTATRFSLTGGPAADLLQHFYRGPETPIFLTQWGSEIQKRLRLLPDRQGPVTALRAFGEPVFWRAMGDLTVAHPWLIYAELMNSEDPRAHEAAEELRREFLTE